MASPSNSERVKASKFRKARDAGTLKPDQARWLIEYESKSTRATIRAAKAGKLGGRPAPLVRGPQLKLGGVTAPSSGAFVHETRPTSNRVDATAHTWTPTMPAAPEGAEPPAPGMPPPTPAGTPLVGEAGQGATGASSAPADPEAGKKIATVITLLVSFGLAAARELLAGSEAPDEVKAMFGSDEVAKEVLATVFGSSVRVAQKYGVTNVPLADELTIAVALVGSGVAMKEVGKKRKLGAKPAPAQVDTQPTTPHRDDPKAPKSELDSLWGQR